MCFLPVFPVACGLVTAGVLVFLSDSFGLQSLAGRPTAGRVVGQVVVGVLVGCLLGLLAAAPLAVLLLLGKRYWPKGMVVVAAGCVLYTGITVSVLVDIVRSDDSTAVLALIFLPAVLAVVLVFFAAAAAVLHRLRSSSGAAP